METAPLKSFAVKARVELRATVGARIAVVLADNSLARVESADAVRILEAAIARDGIEQVIDRVAYTWFNRIIALRFMDANGFTASGVVSPEAGRTTGQPAILAEAKAGTFDSAVVSDATQAKITALLNGTRPSSDPQGEAYGLLLEAYCRAWHISMPFMFERAGDYTELLIPPALLADDSIRHLAVRTLTEEVCSEVEVIGWLYQFYISERKDEVFAGFKRNKKAGAAEIPAATQLFTPHWIVRYLVENSVGRLWMLNNPTSDLAGQMEYYIKPLDEETDFLKISTPEELKVIDPAVGSGHMLTYAFDLLYAIYKERGYDPVEIPGLILEHNLYGTEIDPRAGALAAFALTMKAAAKRKLFLKKPVQPNICVLENICFDSDELDYLWSLTSNTGISRAGADEFWNAFEHADTFGSLIRPQHDIGTLLAQALHTAEQDFDLIRRALISQAKTVVRQGQFVSQRYSAVVANPPYMGGGNMGRHLSDFANASYPKSAQDLCTMFIERGLTLTLTGGRVSMIMPHSWMFLVSFNDLRAEILTQSVIETLVHLGRGVFGSDFASVAFTLAQNKPSTNSRGIYRKLYDRALAVQSNEELIARFQNRSEGTFAIRQNIFSVLPESPLIFSLGESKLELFKKFPALREQGKVAVGLQTSDNPRFLRYWYEVSHRTIGFGLADRQEAQASRQKWFPYNKGGVPLMWWANQELIVNWEHDGRAIRSNKPRSVIRNPDFYFMRSISWSNVGGTPAFREYPEGFIPDSAGTSFYPADQTRAIGIMAFLNSRVMREILEAVAPTLHFDVGQVGSLPVPREVEISEDGEQLVLLAREAWRESERAWDFEGLSFYSAERCGRVSEFLGLHSQRRAIREARVQELELNNDRRALEMLGLTISDLPDERAKGLGKTPSSNLADTVDLVSYAVGCMFGRYSLDEPGLILADQGSTLREYLAKVPNPAFLPDADNVIPIVDGDWFEDDIVAGFRKFLRVSFGEEHFEENLRFVSESLGVKDLRDYFVKSFYDDHVKRYKKRPIYWLFRSPKGSFTALVYLHRYTSSTVSTVLTGYLREFIGKLEANLDYQERVAAGVGDASARDRAAATKEADRIRKVLVELRDYEHDILFPLAGQNIELDLDDGVLVNYQKLGSALKDIGLKKSGSDE